VFKTKDESNKKTLRQQAYVKESLERAFDEMKQARRDPPHRREGCFI